MLWQPTTYYSVQVFSRRIQQRVQDRPEVTCFPFLVACNAINCKLNRGPGSLQDQGRQYTHMVDQLFTKE